jgi:hypothetical protein
MGLLFTDSAAEVCAKAAKKARERTSDAFIGLGFKERIA